MTASAMPTPPKPAKAEGVWDVMVIGGGVVGCAITRRFALAGAKTLMLERGPDILSGASKANSAILHSGFDAPHASLELACMQAGYREFTQIADRLNLPILKSGALVIAWNKEQLGQLGAIVARAHQNGVKNVKQITVKRLHKMEPNLSRKALGAVVVPGEGVVDPWSTPLAYLTQAVEAGAQYRFNAEVTTGEFDGALWRLTTARKIYSGTLVINCTGTNGDVVEKMCRTPGFEILPRKGQFLVFDKSAAGLIEAIILSVPTPTTKGVVLTKTVFGNLLLGPTAQEQTDRWCTKVDHETLQNLLDTGASILPDLPHHAITATYAGLRPATQFKDYRISAEPEKNWIGVNGIRSTGLTSALGIAAHVEHLNATTFPEISAFGPPKKPTWTLVPNLAEHRQRAFQQGDGTEIVCHCEHVTRGEIERTFAAPVPPQCLGGLKRRTRVMMGRCNGFYCSARVGELTDGKIPPPFPPSDPP
ncbi:MAG: NAD(P)/FAD-dependent oxidoreductase [Alphaproteobacteria bacterium]